MNNPQLIQAGSQVKMHYNLCLEDGTLVDSSADHEEPLQFIMGDGTLTPGLEAALVGLSAGAQQSLEIEPGIAFDLPDPANIHVLARSDFEDNSLNLEPDQVVEFQAPNGDTAMGTVLKINEETVEVDFNHPLAGRVIKFDVNIIEVDTPKE